jgi:predicted O-methyltransferase YrrM
LRADRKALADELLRASREHDSNQEDRLARFRNVEPETAELLSLLVAATGARRVLEIGTSNGYSTVWLADAVDQTGGRLLSVEIDPERTALAKANLERAGLDGPTELRTTDAAELLPELEDESVDLVFLDAERPAYAGYWPQLKRVLPPGGLLAVDNAISHEHELVEFSALVEADDAVLSSLVPIGAGLLLVVKRPQQGEPAIPFQP